LHAGCTHFGLGPAKVNSLPVCVVCPGSLHARAPTLRSSKSAPRRRSNPALCQPVPRSLKSLYNDHWLLTPHAHLGVVASDNHIHLLALEPPSPSPLQRPRPCRLYPLPIRQHALHAHFLHVKTTPLGSTPWKLAPDL
jgi:hypothetical protein